MTKPTKPAEPAAAAAAARLNTLRFGLGFSYGEMAGVLGLEGRYADDRVRELESGERPVSGPILRLLDYIAEAVDVEVAPADVDRIAAALPRYLDCTDLSDESDVEIVMHTRWPRFYGFLVDSLPDELVSLHADDPQQHLVKLPDGLGLGWLMIAFIDRPVRDPQPIIAELVRLKVAQARTDLGR